MVQARSILAIKKIVSIHLYSNMYYFVMVCTLGSIMMAIKIKSLFCHKIQINKRTTNSNRRMNVSSCALYTPQ
jgi:hypothetical protein